MNESIVSTQTLHDKKVEQLKGIQKSLNILEGCKRSLQASRSVMNKYIDHDDKIYLKELDRLYDSVLNFQGRIKRRYF